MLTVIDLWVPILLAAVFVFIASSLLHVVIPIHKGDFSGIPGEDSVLDSLRAQGITPGTYVFPFAESMKEMGSPEMIEKSKRGPVGFLTVVPSGAPGMGKSLVQWFIYTILLGAFVGYAGLLALDRGAEYMEVFRFTGTVAVIGYALSSIPESIWKGQGWFVTMKFIFDGVVYATITAGTFGWMWPGAVSP